MTHVVAYVPDLMDRSRITATARDVEFVAKAADLECREADVLVVDLSRPGALDVLPRLAGRRVVAFGSHVDRDLLAGARAAGCEEVLPRSQFFARLADLLA